ncbi:MAG: hypothetical protein CEE43_00320 [Promethearchaeota archaeon Loki_b32]|nr:MAG: hypothetical protein CEE43_00320 [Candidatus Lokiarchaeota archaeon Loki_b32]
MKKFGKIVLSAFTLMMVFTLMMSINVNATGHPDEIVEVPGDSIKTQLQSNIMTTFRFRERTQLTLYANVDLDLDINCEALRIAEKDFMIEIEGGHHLKLTMTCTREENQLGLMDGNTMRVRNRNTYRYLEGFCISIECEPKYDCQCNCECQCLNECQCVCDCECQCQNDCQCVCDCECQCLNECQCQNECQCICNCGEEQCFLKARLRIRETSQNRAGQWAYYNENNEEWVTVPTVVEDGYLTAETTHFSTWTVLIPTVATNGNTSLILGSSVSIAVIGAIIGISVIYTKKRKI